MPTGLPQEITEDDPEWVLHFCNFFDAWTWRPEPGGKSMGEGIVVIQPDTGWTTHPELWDSSRIVDGEQADDRYLIHKAKNFVEPGQLAADELEETIVLIEPHPLARNAYYNGPIPTTRGLRHPSHGTACASVLMSKRGRPDITEFPEYPIGPGFVSGVAPLAKIIPYKVAKTVILTADSSVSLGKSIHYARNLSKSSTLLHDDGSQIGVVSISLGGRDSMAKKPQLEAALVEARLAGIVVVAAAGQLLNEWTDKLGLGPTYPGNDPNTICVAACDSKHEKYTKGLYGSAVDITAPGCQKIWKAHAEKSGINQRHNAYSAKYSDGTSYAAAIVAGACALWQAHHGRANLLRDYGPELIFDLFKKVLRDSCDNKPPNWTEWDFANRGAGILDAKGLLQHTLPPRSEIERIRGG